MCLMATPGRMWSLSYAAPEVLEGSENTPCSDLARLGYVLVEMLAGQPPFAGRATYREFVLEISIFAGMARAGSV